MINCLGLFCRNRHVIVMYMVMTTLKVLGSVDTKTGRCRLLSCSRKAYRSQLDCRAACGIEIYERLYAHL